MQILLTILAFLAIIYIPYKIGKYGAINGNEEDDYVIHWGLGIILLGLSIVGISCIVMIFAFLYNIIGQLLN